MEIVIQKLIKIVKVFIVPLLIQKAGINDVFLQEDVVNFGMFKSEDSEKAKEVTCLLVQEEILAGYVEKLLKT